MLLRGLLGAMERDGRIRFVSTGGGSQGYNEGVYERFRRAALASPFAARFHFLGWLGRDEAEAIHAECDVGISLDRWCAEAVLGARNRLVNWLDLGLPAASTAVCEAARLLAEAQGMIELPLGDAEAVAAILAALPGQPQRLRETLRRGQAHVRQRYGFRQVMAPLLEWARAPRRAGDFRQPSAIAAHADFETLARERDRLAAEVASLSDRKQWLGRFRQAARRRLFGEE
ncbi:MAG: hypothetical protein BWZ10_02463 [candidate division BRC1 bacterium ADurb.BinA364]|nr:MAG: hypothetical protein BWZ10_02463 [candidate division BRC1 bacterium ADurb.BinA364]